MKSQLPVLVVLSLAIEAQSFFFFFPKRPTVSPEVVRCNKITGVIEEFTNTTSGSAGCNFEQALPLLEGISNDYDTRLREITDQQKISNPLNLRLRKSRLVKDILALNTRIKGIYPATEQAKLCSRIRDAIIKFNRYSYTVIYQTKCSLSDHKSSIGILESILTAVKARLSNISRSFLTIFLRLTIQRSINTITQLISDIKNSETSSGSTTIASSVGTKVALSNPEIGTFSALNSIGNSDTTLTTPSAGLDNPSQDTDKTISNTASDNSNKSLTTSRSDLGTVGVATDSRTEYYTSKTPNRTSGSESGSGTEGDKAETSRTTSSSGLDYLSKYNEGITEWNDGQVGVFNSETTFAETYADDPSLAGSSQFTRTQDNVSTNSPKDYDQYQPAVNDFIRIPGDSNW